MQAFSITGNYTDLYELTMGQSYFLQGKAQEPACFDYFFRKIPFGGGAVICRLRQPVAVLGSRRCPVGRGDKTVGDMSSFRPGKEPGRSSTPSGATGVQKG